MKSFTIYNNLDEILRTGVCPNKDFKLQTQGAEKIIEGFCDTKRQKIVDDEIVDKTPEEIEADKPVEIPFEKRRAGITKGQWQEVLDRIRVLESEV